MWTKSKGKNKKWLDGIVKVRQGASSKKMQLQLYKRGAQTERSTGVSLDSVFVEAMAWDSIMQDEIEFEGGLLVCDIEPKLVASQETEGRPRLQGPPPAAQPRAVQQPQPRRHQQRGAQPSGARGSFVAPQRVPFSAAEPLQPQAQPRQPRQLPASQPWAKEPAAPAQDSSEPRAQETSQGGGEGTGGQGRSPEAEHQSVARPRPKPKRPAAQMLVHADSRTATRARTVRTVHDADAAVAALGLRGARAADSGGAYAGEGSDADAGADSEFWALSRPPSADFAIAGEAVRSDTGRSFWQSAN